MKLVDAMKERKALEGAVAAAQAAAVQQEKTEQALRKKVEAMGGRAVGGKAMGPAAAVDVDGKAVGARKIFTYHTYTEQTKTKAGNDAIPAKQVNLPFGATMDPGSRLFGLLVEL